MSGRLGAGLMMLVLGVEAVRGQAAHGGGGGGAGSHGGGGGSHGPPSPQELANMQENNFLSKWLIASLTCFAALPILYHFAIIAYGHVRLLASLNDNQQRYFAKRTSNWIPWLKKNIFYAPLLTTRHNKEFQVSKAINMGTLPTRFQFFFLLGYLCANIVFCTWKIGYDGETAAMLSEVRNRTGVMATVNMLPLFLLAGRNNPLIWIMGMSFDTFNLLHRWLGRIVVVEALVHTIAWVTSRVTMEGWPAVMESLGTGPFYMWGLAGTVAFTFLLIQSPSVLRHAFYETFLAGHIVAAVIAVMGVYYHLKLKPELVEYLKYILIVIAIWSYERIFRIFRLIYRNIAWKKCTKIRVEILPADAVRVTISIPRPWNFRAGQHLYLYVPRVGMWQSHPFTIVWGATHKVPKYLVDRDEDEKIAFHKEDLAEVDETTLSLLIAKRTGFTEKLYNFVDNCPERTVKMFAMVEGPYGKIDTLGSYGTVLLVAGGVGITHPVPFIRDLVAGYADGIVATRRVVLVWVIQSQDHLEWIRPWMNEILSMPKRREILKIILHVTRPESKKEIISPSSTVQMFPGRPNFDQIIQAELQHRIGTMAVTVCGSGSLSDDVRKAVRDNIDRGTIEFIEEAFSW